MEEELNLRLTCLLLKENNIHTDFLEWKGPLLKWIDVFT